MELLKQINERTNAYENEVNVVLENIRVYLDDDAEVILENAEEFLGNLSLLVRNDKLSDEDNSKKNHLAMLAALMMLRKAKARAKIKANSVDSYLRLIDNVTRNLKLTSFETNIIKQLDSMINDNGQTGLDLRDRYIKMYDNDKEQLVRDINKLQSSYRQIYAHLKQMASTGDAKMGAVSAVA